MHPTRATCQTLPGTPSRCPAQRAPAEAGRHRNHIVPFSLLHHGYMYLVMPGRQLPAAGVSSPPSLTANILVAFVSETNPSTSSITASATPATLAWILGWQCRFWTAQRRHGSVRRGNGKKSKQAMDVFVSRRLGHPAELKRRFALNPPRCC